MKRSVFLSYFPVFLFFYHLLFTYVAWDYVLHFNGDAVRYWFVGQDLSEKSWLSFFQPGTDIIKLLTFPLVKFLHLPFWSGFLLFSCFSYYGFYKLWHIILSFTKNNNTAFFTGVVLILLPNLHLWTSFIGKESLLFVALVCLVEKMMSHSTKSPLFLLSFLVIAVIRPHVAIVLLVALVIAFIWKGTLTRKNLLKMSLLAIPLGAGLYALITKVALIKTNPVARIVHIYQYHIKGLKETAAYVPLDEYALPSKLFTFYFRPLPFEKAGWLYQIWSLENLILLVLVLIAGFTLVRNFKKITWDRTDIFSIFAILLLAVMYVYAYANYGLIARTKIMSMPFMYLFIVKVLAKIPAAQSLRL